MVVTFKSFTMCSSIKSALKNLLLEELPKNDKSIVNNDKYLAIKKDLDSRDVEIEFLISIKPNFDEFMFMLCYHALYVNNALCRFEY